MDVFTLAAKLSLDSKGFAKDLQKQESGFKKFGNKVSKFVGVVAKGATALTSAASASIVPIIKNATSAYANFEQLAGGVETLFKQAAVFVRQDADEAFKTAGMSANQYMETATSFAASLIQGLQGDTLAAAEYANRAIVDMSDNANKMGTDMESIQNAYRGFSKQNFTMLDNLKLGYGGTKQEMERLLKDAEKLTGQKYDVSNFADIVDAIHAIQVEMGVTGTTAKEASTTISGSWNQTKAAWQNLLVTVADPKGNIKKATANLVSSAKTTLKNVLPTIRQAISGFGDFVTEVAPMIGEYLPELISDFVPKFWDAGKRLLSGLGKGIFDGIKKIKWPTWKDVKTFAGNAWNKIQSGIDSLGGLIFGRNDDGTVKWPSIKSITNAASQWWKEKELTAINSVTAWALQIFENPAETAEDIAKKVSKWWEDNSIGDAISKAVSWTLGIFGINISSKTVKTTVEDWWKGVVSSAQEALKWVLGLPKMSDPIQAGAELRKVIFNWWGIVKRVIGNVTTLLFGVSGAEDESGEGTAGAIKTWWDNKVVPLLEGAGQFSLGLFGEDSIVAKALNGTLTALRDIGNWILGNWSSVSQGLTDLGGAIEVIGAALTGYWVGTKLALFASTVKKFLSFEVTGFSKTGLILSGIAAGLMLIYENWDTIQPALVEIGNWVNDNIIKPFTEAISRIETFLKELGLVSDESETLSGGLGVTSAENEDIVIPYKYGKAAEIVTKALGKKEADELSKSFSDAIKTGDFSEFEKNFRQKMLAAGKSTTEVEGAVNALKKACEEAAGEYKLTWVMTTTGTPPPVDVTNTTKTNNRDYDNASQGKFAKGAWDIPYDDFPALLHRNEMVLNATQARQYREGGAGAGLTATDVLSIFKTALSNLTLELDDRELARAVVRYGGNGMGNYLSARNKKAQAGYGT